MSGPAVCVGIDVSKATLDLALRPTGERWSLANDEGLHSGQHFLSQALNGEDIGLEEVQDGLWNLLYYDTLLGRFNEHTHTITGAPSLKGKC